MKNVINLCGLGDCVYIADKGFYSESNILEIEDLGMEYIIPLRRDNKLIDYTLLAEVELSENYFEFDKRFIFYTESIKKENRNIEVFLDGRLRELEKTDYLRRIKSVPESYSKEKFNDKISSMGTLSIIHNTNLNAKEIYFEYKNRGK
ncbi:MAG: transposase [Moheibacter sp.]